MKVLSVLGAARTRGGAGAGIERHYLWWIVFVIEFARSVVVPMFCLDAKPAELIAMARTYISGDEADELRALYEQHVRALKHATEVLAKHGMPSPEFEKADAEAGAIWRRIRQILGTAEEHWMS